VRNRPITHSEILGVDAERPARSYADSAIANKNTYVTVLEAVVSPTVPAPTQTPTSTPTPPKPTPTKYLPSPTAIIQPTAMPTVAPTVRPTVIPTVAPTIAPTIVPTLPSNICDQAFNVALLTEINNYRALKGKPPYSLDNLVSLAACNHSEWMRTTGIFSHTETNTLTPYAEDRCLAVGTTCSGENITWGNDYYVLPANIVTRWSGSPDHNGNMLGAYTRIGIGKSGNYVTVDFGF
jgi:uncharacterized protein YkwD